MIAEMQTLSGAQIEAGLILKEALEAVHASQTPPESWQRGDPRWCVNVIDSTNLTIDQVVDRIVGWVQAKQRRPSS